LDNIHILGDDDYIDELNSENKLLRDKLKILNNCMNKMVDKEIRSNFFPVCLILYTDQLEKEKELLKAGGGKILTE
jgi:hypothetical protein